MLGRPAMRLKREPNDSREFDGCGGEYRSIRRQRRFAIIDLEEGGSPILGEVDGNGPLVSNDGRLFALAACQLRLKLQLEDHVTGIRRPVVPNRPGSSEN